MWMNIDVDRDEKRGFGRSRVSEVPFITFGSFVWEFENMFGR